jgi:hypothetical protein
MENTPNYWLDFFTRWPTDVHRRGIIVTAYNDQINFSAFWTSPRFIMLERQTPDSMGARTVFLPYDQIVALKITDVIKPKQFKVVGFEGATVGQDT